MLKFSVLMSVYKNDDSKHLKSALESIYENQTLKPNEIVIVLDGPLTSELYNTIDKFKNDKDPIVIIVPLEKNVGLGEALRIGTTYCSYEYIFRMDADDISDSKRFESQVKYLKNNPNIDVLGSDIKEFSVDYRNENMRIRHVPNFHREIVKMAKRRNPMNHVTVCIKKSALEKCGGYETLLLLEDYFLWLKMIVNNCRLENMNEALVYVRTGKDFNHKRSSKIRITGWRILQDYMYENGMIKKWETVLNMLYIKSFVGMPSFVKRILYSFVLRR
ncbi:MAG TPA: glycosyltransferase [Gallicola sp.]|nr:glycosyltransferase [Gallicola sp.]